MSFSYNLRHLLTCIAAPRPYQHQVNSRSGSRTSTTTQPQVDIWPRGTSPHFIISRYYSQESPTSPAPTRFARIHIVTRSARLLVPLLFILAATPLLLPTASLAYYSYSYLASLATLRLASLASQPQPQLRYARLQNDCESGKFLATYTKLAWESCLCHWSKLRKLLLLVGMLVEAYFALCLNGVFAIVLGLGWRRDNLNTLLGRRLPHGLRGSWDVRWRASSHSSAAVDGLVIDSEIGCCEDWETHLFLRPSAGGVTVALGLPGTEAVSAGRTEFEGLCT